jgi:hypothetical protein
MMTNRLTREQVDAFLARHKDFSEARRFLQEAGLIDANGELTKEYRPYPVHNLRQASTDVPDVELELCWWQKAARKKIEGKAQAIFDAYCTLADLRNRSVSESEMLAAALRETINQCQDSQGMISAPELLRIATQLDVAEDDIDLFQAQ